MPARAEFRDRDAVEVAVLDALVARAEDGTTVLELRSQVDADIDRIEAALTALKSDGLIRVEETDERVRLYPDDRVVPDPGEAPTEEVGVLEALRRAVFGDAHDENGHDPDYDVQGPVGRTVERLKRLFRR